MKELTDEQLAAQLKSVQEETYRREKIKKQAISDALDAKGLQAAEQAELLLLFTPDHYGNHTDEDIWDMKRCARCSLLYALESGGFPEQYELVITVKDRPDYNE